MLRRGYGKINLLLDHQTVERGEFGSYEVVSSIAPAEVRTFDLVCKPNECVSEDEVRKKMNIARSSAKMFKVSKDFSFRSRGVCHRGILLRRTVEPYQAMCGSPIRVPKYALSQA